MLLYYIIWLLISLFFFISDLTQLIAFLQTPSSIETPIIALDLFLIPYWAYQIYHTTPLLFLPPYKLSSIKDLQTMTMTLNLIYLIIFLLLFSYNLKTTISSLSTFHIFLTALTFLCSILQTLNIFIPYYATKI